jgi:two-component system chemotaxis sensor kinase CheA
LTVAYSDRIIQGFRDDARQLLEAINYNLVRLEQNPSDPELINEIFRHAHSLKGSAALMGFDLLADTAHRIEDIFSLVKNGRLQASAELVTFLLESNDLLENLLKSHLDATPPPEAELARFHSRVTTWLPSVSAPQPAAVIVSDSSDQPSASLPALLLTDFEKEIVASEQQKHQSVYLVNLRLQPDVSLRYARAFLVYTNLQTAGRVIKTVPDINMSENDELFSVFRVLISTGLTVKEIENNVEDSEIASIEIKPWEEPRSAEPAVAALRPVQLDTGIRIPAEDLNSILDHVSELHILRGEMASLKGPVMENLTDSVLYDRFSEAVFRLETVVTGLQDGFMKVRMTPVDQLFRPFFRYVREAASKMGKEVELETSGDTTLIDRSVIEKLIDPLSHLIRNSLSHGIETRTERQALSKPVKGKITLSAVQSGNTVTLEIADDGRGMDLETIRSVAVRKGVIPSDKTITEKDLLDIICAPGFSTERSISDISGRGVGMDVVRTAVDGLQGSLELSTRKGSGTSFKLTIPLSLSLVKTLLASSAGGIVGIPLSFVQDTFVIPTSDLSGRTFPFVRDGLPLLCLDTIWAGLPFRPSGDFVQCIRLVSHGRPIGLVASEIVREEDLVLKPTDPVFFKHPYIAGGSILGDGRVVFLLNAVKFFDLVTA